jgi:hypothetical protein
MTTKPPLTYCQPRNLTYHNLCTINKVPPGTKQLLGLNLKYCLSTNHLHQDINKTVLKMAYSIRTLYHLKELGINKDSHYEKQIYINNRQWNPPPAPLLLEDKLTDFEKEAKAKQERLLTKLQKRNLSNLSPIQANALRQLRDNTNLLIKPTDKNLGPAIMDTVSYIKQVLKEHLLTPTYKQLTYMEAKSKMDTIKANLKLLLSNNKNILSKSEWVYFDRSLQLHHRLPVFYGLPKVHKNPVTLRPVVSGINSLLSVFSNWLDYKLKVLLPHVKSFVKDSATVIKELKSLHIPQNALLFSADATSMYTNIETQLGVASIQALLSNNTTLLPPNYPTNLILQMLTIIMENNIFSFADTFWKQQSGTAMGTPVACTYAMLSFGQYENAEILPNYQSNLIYYRRYIDDILGIWIPSPCNNNNSFESFKLKLNSWGSLKWVVQEPSTKVQFLDLNITLDNSTIRVETYQKPMNLYLYIPPLSAHPPSCFKGLIFGELRRYWSQNSPETFQKLLSKFIQRLVDRGHTLKQLIPIISQAAITIDQKGQQRATLKKDDSSTLYIHWRYHPAGIQRSDIRQIYNKTLQPYLPYDNMRVAISRPTNLRDRLTNTVLTTPKGINLENLIKEMSPQAPEKDALSASII